MKPWMSLSIFLSTVGFFNEFTPSEYYFDDYLLEQNHTIAVYNVKIYPVFKSGEISCSVLCIFITDILLYKPIIIFGAICGLITFSLMLEHRTLTTLLIAEVNISKCACRFFLWQTRLFYNNYKCAEITNILTPLNFFPLI